MSKSDNEEREKRILDAAVNLIIHYGYDKTTVSDIAREAGISKGAIYLHFESKEALLEALIQRDILQHSENWLRRVEADPAGGTFTGLYKHALYALEETSLMRYLLKQDRRVLGSYLTKENILNTNTTMRQDFVRMMQEAGAVRKDIDPQVIAHIMNLISYGLLVIEDYLDEEQIPPLDAVIDGIGKVMDSALTPPDGGNPQAATAIIKQLLAALKLQLTQKPD